jgi:hypothetical protein
MGSEWVLGRLAGVIEWIQLVQDSNRWRDIVITMTNIRVLEPRNQSVNNSRDCVYRLWMSSLYSFLSLLVTCSLSLIRWFPQPLLSHTLHLQSSVYSTVKTNSVIHQIWNILCRVWLHSLSYYKILALSFTVLWLCTGVASSNCKFLSSSCRLTLSPAFSLRVNALIAKTSN